MKVPRTFPTLAFLLLGACGSESSTPYADASSTGGDENTAEIRFSGVVRLRGGVAESEYGCVFVSVKPKGVTAPSYSRRYTFKDPEVGAPDGGERILSFELTEADIMGGLIDGEHVLEAWFDPDCSVDTKEGGLRESVPVGRGGDGLEVALGEE